MTEPKHDPSPDEITTACAAIRAGWSAAEERKRRAWTLAPAELATVKVAELEANCQNGA